ncbi:hypothetical protein [Paracoccus saliphilus]|uniref:Uncharacterized protein n=1 Tax=Paracoccus saliphilus TaxID=405559 RepID=A0AA45W6E5_9RHOB|nr:hypothetical protein [Paracoccus saliphilus]WCR04448.1 hypothetical protein JHX88_06900 [Paracoccus saliphilus]SIT01195.1 hypothetical protein SAMN05421772_11267 [Paracoccus saliphilus]
MKVITTGLVALALAAGAASASNFPETHRNASVERPAPNTTQIEVKAGKVLTTRELQSANLSADDLITVTSFPTSEWAKTHYER